MEIHTALPEWDYVTEQFVYYEEEHTDCSRGVKYMLSELSNMRKMFVNYDEAHDFFIRAAKTQGLSITHDDINEAYNIAYGIGCEYEWK